MIAVIGKKVEQTQRFLEDGTRIPVTRIDVSGNVVVDIKTQEKNNYSALALAFGTNPKNKKKSLLGIAKKAKLENTPRLIKEIRIEEEKDLPEIGTIIKVEEVLSPGDIIQVTGISKGKGFAGGVKRYHFRGGPKTHGQSDRHRAPGSIGQGTTPGRVYKGKRMAGNMGHEKVTVSNLKVVDIQGEELLVAGLVPGPVNNILVIKKTGELGKKFVPLTKTQEQLDAEQKAREEEEARLAKEQEAQAKVESAEGAEDLEAKGRETPSNTEKAAQTPAEEAQQEAAPVEAKAETPAESEAGEVTEDKKEEKKEENKTE
jgi:large subunit ribosomal protein L3